MPLDDLVQVIETLKERIGQYGDSLRQNEIRTRVALIDPLLTALGWDVANPALVTAEFDVSGRRADYALRSAGNIPAATIEAKKLGEPLDSHRLQVLNYSNAAGIRYAGLTDGSVWEFYEIFKQGTLEERRILDVSIVGEEAFQCSLKFLLLWRTNLGLGRPREANQPLLNLESLKPTSREEVIEPQTIHIEEDDWHSLADIQDYKKLPNPASIRFPNEGEREI